MKENNPKKLSKFCNRKKLWNSLDIYFMIYDAGWQCH